MTTLKLIGLLAAHLLMTGLPGIAVVLICLRRGLGRVPILLGIALASSGAIAMLGFWLYWADPLVGKVFSWVILIAAALVVIRLLPSSRIDRGVLRELAVPLALWVFGTAFLVFLGFNHGGTNEPVALASYRFSAGGLPSDNDIPRFFAAWFYANGHSPRPPIYPGDWTFSDRPPLQVGYMLMQMPMGWDRDSLNYQLIGVCLQQLWIVGLWALLLAARLGRVTRALAVVLVLASDLTIVNGFFVWPKLLPAAMLLAAAALILTPQWRGVRRDPALAALVGALLALAMLGHGSSIFAVIPLAIVAIARGAPSWRPLLALVASGLVLYVPWQAYQKYGDPPGDRLVIWSLAGVESPDHRGVLRDIESAYRQAGLEGTLHHKAENVVTIAGGGPMADELKPTAVALVHGRFNDADLGLRSIDFLFLLPSLGLLLIAVPLSAIGRLRNRIRSAEWTFATIALTTFGIGMIIWVLLLFGNQVSRAVIHQGSYALPILAFCGLLAATRATFPRVAVWLVALNVVVSLIIYFPSPFPVPGSHLSAAASALTGLSLIAFVVGAFGYPNHITRRPPWGARGRSRALAAMPEDQARDVIHLDEARDMTDTR